MKYDYFTNFLVTDFLLKEILLQVIFYLSWQILLNPCP